MTVGQLKELLKEANDTATVYVRKEGNSNTVENLDNVVCVINGYVNYKDIKVERTVYLEY